jgi:hypothetical protein
MDDEMAGMGYLAIGMTLIKAASEHDEWHSGSGLVGGPSSIIK